jgi:heme exporter protein D
MNGTGWADFIAMGGYGLYVWGSLGVCALTMALEVALLGRRGKVLRSEVMSEAELSHGDTMP